MSETTDLITSNNDLFRINCKDIFLREFREEDLEEYHALTWQSDVVEFLPDWSTSKEQRLDWLVNYEIKENQKFLDAVAKDGDIKNYYLRLGIILKETNEFIGWCCTGIKDELPAPNREIVYALSKNYQGKGYTTQAAKGLITFLFENTQLNILNALALVHNLPSNRVIQKCGFYFQNTLDIEHESYNYYQLSKRQWREKA